MYRASGEAASACGVEGIQRTSSAGAVRVGLADWLGFFAAMYALRTAPW